MRDAVDIKVQLVRWLNALLSEDELLASELRFQDGARRADLAVIGPGRLCALEVKGPRDDFRRLLRQLEAYQRLFLEVHVAVESAALSELRSMIPKTVGILLVTGEKVEIARKARKRTHLNAADAASWLLVSDLRSLLTKCSSTETRAELIRRASTELSGRALTKAAITAAYARLLPRYAAYRAELGQNVTSDDIRTLSIPTAIDVKPRE